MRMQSGEPVWMSQTKTIEQVRTICVHVSFILYSHLSFIHPIRSLVDYPSQPGECVVNRLDTIIRNLIIIHHIYYNYS